MEFVQKFLKTPISSISHAVGIYFSLKKKEREIESLPLTPITNEIAQENKKRLGQIRGCRDEAISFIGNKIKAIENNARINAKALEIISSKSKGSKTMVLNAINQAKSEVIPINPPEPIRLPSEKQVQ